MGNGPNGDRDVAKARPWAARPAYAPATIGNEVADEAQGPVIDLDVAAGVGDPSGESEPAMPIDFCERRHRLRFETLPGAAAHLRQVVRLAIADPPRVASETGEHIGVIADGRGQPILQCLADGYVIAGQIVALDSGNRSGDVVVSGRPDPGRMQ
jgi:hypothetical protein